MEPKQESPGPVDLRKPSPSREDEEARLNLGPLGREAVRYLNDERQKTFARLKKQSTLHLWAAQREQAAKESIARLVESGMKPEEAWELVAGQYLELPAGPG